MTEFTVPGAAAISNMRRRFGTLAAGQHALYRLANTVMRLEWLNIIVLDRERLRPLDPARTARLSSHLATLPELEAMQPDARLDMHPGRLDAFRAGDSCLLSFVDGELAGYTWAHTMGRPELVPGLVVSVPLTVPLQLRGSHPARVPRARAAALPASRAVEHRQVARQAGPARIRPADELRVAARPGQERLPYDRLDLPGGGPPSLRGAVLAFAAPLGHAPAVGAAALATGRRGGRERGCVSSSALHAALRRGARGELVIDAGSRVGLVFLERLLAPAAHGPGVELLAVLAEQLARLLVALLDDAPRLCRRPACGSRRTVRRARPRRPRAGCPSRGRTVTGPTAADMPQRPTIWRAIAVICSRSDSAPVVTSP